MIEFSYGHGTYREGTKNFEGQIILGEHKLYLKGDRGDIAQTYIPLEKIERLHKTAHGLQVHVRPATYFRYSALFNGEKKHISSLVKELVRRRGLKKQFLKSVWVESEY